MDLNLYLGPPHSPIRGGSDLGSDLALGSIPLLSEEIRSPTEMSGVVEALDSHAPYSPTHASYTSNQDAVEPLDSSGIRIPRFEYSSFDPPTSYGLVSQLPNNERNGSSRLEYCPYAPNYIPALLDIQQTGNEPSHPDANAPLGHVPYSPPYAPVSTTEQASREPVVVEDDNDHVEYVPRSPSYNPEMPAPVLPEQSNGVLVLEDVDPYVPSSPSYVPISTTGQDSGRPVVLEDGNNDIEYVPTSQTINLVTAPASPQPNGSLIAEDVDPYVPSSPSFIPFMPTTQVPHDRSNNENSRPAGAVSQLQRTMQNIEPLAIDDSSDEGIMQYRQNRLRRLIESHQRLRLRRFRSTAPYRVDPLYGASSLSLEDHILQESLASERAVETSGTGNHKVGAESLVVGDTEEETKDQDSGAANFECNICLDMAKEPVVTSCGHLFCWPCLYQWLHLHCDHKECPVCKGEVTESNITPIYGRGSTEIGVEKTGAHEGDSSLKIPPRPRGHRFESLRQQIRRPFSRRLGHELSSWRRIVDEEIRNGNRAEGQEPPLPSIFDVSNSRVFTRLRAAQRFRREGSSENVLNLVGATGLPRNTAETALNSQSGSSQGDGHNGGSRSSPALPDSFDFWHRLALFGLPGFPSSERLAAVTASLSSVMERMTGIASHSGASASVNPQNAETLHNQGTQGATPGADQASSSSTMAVIQGDAGVVNATAEASGAGSSRPLRRRRRSGASSSLDLDGGVHHAHKRRRIN